MKPQSPKSLRTAIQVLVFQDGLSSRNFEIPLAWITRLGWYFGGSLLVTILAVSTSVHFWRQSHRAQPERLRELEQQIRLLGEARHQAETSVTPSAPAPAPSLVPAVATAPAATAVPAAPVVCSVPAQPPAPAALQAPCAPNLGARPASGAAALIAFRSFPSSVVSEIPLVARPAVPLEISSPSIQWQGRKLKFQFDIRFTGKEGDNQQGRIFVLARGPDVLLGYPSGAIQAAESPHLFDTEKGEFFSVSRFRQTKVEFPAVDSNIQALEILLFGVDRRDGEQKLLIREMVKVPPPRGGAREAATPEES